MLRYSLTPNTDLCLIDAVHDIDNSKWREMIIPCMIVNLLKIQIMAILEIHLQMPQF